MLPKLAQKKALEKSLGIKDQSCPVLRLSHNVRSPAGAVVVCAKGKKPQVRVRVLAP